MLKRQIREAHEAIKGELDHYPGADMQAARILDALSKIGYRPARYWRVIWTAIVIAWLAVGLGLELTRSRLSVTLHCGDAQLHLSMVVGWPVVYGGVLVAVVATRVLDVPPPRCEN